MGGRLPVMLRRRAGLIAVLALTAPTVSCTGGDAASPAPTTSTSPPPVSAPAAPATSATETAPVIKLQRPNAPVTVTIRQLGRGVPRNSRSDLRAAIGRPINAWVHAGFAAGRYPRAGFLEAFGSWTQDAARLARSDRNVTTNAVLGPHVFDVSVTRAQARLFVFAAAGATGGATARVDLRLRESRTNGPERVVRVTGDLYLTRHRSRWLIFGYDLHREVR